MISRSSSQSRTPSGMLRGGSRRACRPEGDPAEEVSMPNATRTITIGRPPDEVFGFFANHANDRIWRPAVAEIDPVDGGAVGTRIHQVVKGPGGRGIAADIEVTANERPSRYAFQVVAGP